jgi:hypothetical protein
MDHSYRNLAIEAAFWLTSIAGCAVALILNRRAPPKWLGLSMVLALFALTVGYLGLWTPFSFVPRIWYGWASGDYSLQIDLNRFFIVPLVLGSLALVLLAWCYWRSNRAIKAVGPSQV